MLLQVGQLQLRVHDTCRVSWEDDPIWPGLPDTIGILQCSCHSPSHDATVLECFMWTRLIDAYSTALGRISACLPGPHPGLARLLSQSRHALQDRKALDHLCAIAVRQLSLS